MRLCCAGGALISSGTAACQASGITFLASLTIIVIVVPAEGRAVTYALACRSEVLAATTHCADVLLIAPRAVGRGPAVRAREALRSVCVGLLALAARLALLCIGSGAVGVVVVVGSAAVCRDARSGRVARVLLLQIGGGTCWITSCACGFARVALSTAGYHRITVHCQCDCKDQGQSQ